MKIYTMYKEMEGKVINFPNGWAHPTIVNDVGNSKPVEITIEGGYAKYKGKPLKLSVKGWQTLYYTFKGVL